VLSARHGFALFGKPGCRTETASSTWPCPPVWPTLSPARAGVLNAMSYLVSTFISPPWSARPDHPVGGTGGGTGPCAGCSPRPARLPFMGDAPCDDPSTFGAGVKSLLTAGLRRLRSGGALCRPLSLTGTLPQLKGEPWRERPRVLAASAITSAPRAGRSRHGCLVLVDVRPLTFLRVDTTAKPWPLSAAVLSRSVQRNQRAMRSP
jgi:hypothetical protein